MKKVKITTPENIEIEYTLADIGSRVGAAVIDIMIQTIAIIILGAGVFLAVYYSPGLWENYYGWIIGVSILLGAIISYGYYILMELTMNGMTPGKKILGIRTIRNNGQPVTLKHSAIRNLFKVFIDMYGIGVVMIFLTKEHKRIGDFAASTIVVAEESRMAPVTLESLKRIDDKLSYYLSGEEHELLREYIERRYSMEDSNEIREKLKHYFTKKFEKMGVLDEFEGFIREL